MTFVTRTTIFLLTGLCWTNTLFAQLDTPPFIGPGMVIQRNFPIPIRGSAEAGSMVYVELNGQSDSTLSSGSGSWKTSLPPMNEGGPYTLTIRSGDDSLLYSDVYVGDVWLASGQSNMQWELKDSDSASEEIANASYPGIRQFYLPKVLGNTPRDELLPGSSWTPAISEYVGEFTAVGYYFARHLHNHLDIPVGIINASYGGTKIESWMSKEMLGFDEQDIVFGEGESYLQATVAYNAMIHPIAGIPLKGVIWYQGESNMGNREGALMYTGQLKKLISSWRELWGQGDIPFLWVQLPNTGTEANENLPAAWDALPMFRAAQSRALSLPNTGEATGIDTGEPDIHPTNKKPVGERLALVARKVAYGESLGYSGPRYKSHRKLEDGQVEITFDHAESGLVARETGADSIRWFSIAGGSGKLYRASATIESNRVLVWNNAIADPEIIRYAWESNPFNINFYNQDGLPAVPFKIRVSSPGFGIESFESTAYAIDKGESAVLTWQINGALEARLDQRAVDTIGGIRVWPDSDTTFTLHAQAAGNPDILDSATVRIMVREPIPTIVLSASEGEMIAPGTEISISATVSAPLGGTVELVQFFVNGIIIDSVSRAPFETTWIPDSTGVFNITGMVTNQLGLTRTSDTLVKHVVNLKKVLFEAEGASLKGGKRILDSDLASGGKYVDFSVDWEIIFPGIELEEACECQLTIGYMLNYGSPRTQYLRVNEGPVQPITFVSAESGRWERYFMKVALDSAINQISMEGFYGYMSLDYISLAFVDTSVPNGDISFRDPPDLQLQVLPNPAGSYSILGFQLPRSGHLVIEIYDLSGRKAGVILDRNMDAGKHSLPYDSGELDSGIYFIRSRFEDSLIVTKLVVL